MKTLDARGGLCYYCHARVPVRRLSPKLLVPKIPVTRECIKCRHYCPTDALVDKMCPICYLRDQHAKKEITCSRCSSKRMLHVLSNVGTDNCYLRLDNSDSNYHAPPDLNMGQGGDHVEFDVCANCGQMQGLWPLPEDIMTRN